MQRILVPFLITVFIMNTPSISLFSIAECKSTEMANDTLSWNFSSSDVIGNSFIPFNEKYAITGESRGHLVLLCIDDSGNEVYRKTAYAGQTKGKWIENTKDDHLIVLGSSYTLNGWDYVLYKFDRQGNEIWNRTYGGPFDDYCYQVLPSDDGGYFLIGSVGQYEDSDAWIIKTDSFGNILWTRSVGGSDWDNFKSIVEFDDSLYIVGTTASYGSGSSDVWLVKMTSTGIEEWNKTYGKEHSDSARAILIDSNSLVILGRSEEVFESGQVIQKGHVYQLDKGGNIEMEIETESVEYIHTAIKHRDEWLFSGISNIGLQCSVSIIEVSVTFEEKWSYMFSDPIRPVSTVQMHNSPDGFVIMMNHDMNGSGLEVREYIDLNNNGFQDEFPSEDPDRKSSNLMSFELLLIILLILVVLITIRKKRRRNKG